MRPAVRLAVALAGVAVFYVASALLPPASDAQRGIDTCVGDPIEDGEDALDAPLRPGLAGRAGNGRGATVSRQATGAARGVGNGREARGVRPGSANPLAGLSFYVDPSEPAAEDFRRYLARGEAGKAREIAQLALAPKFRWFGSFSPMSHVRNYIAAAECAGTVPQMVTLRHQGKRCNPGYQAGGPAEDRRTEAWFREFARTVGTARVVIAYEPDSIGTIECLARGRRAARRRVLRYGVDVLSRLPNATIYIEATASDWKSVAFTARTLRYLGVAKVRGFMLNVTHYDWTSNNVRYGNAVSRRVGGKPFVIKTSYNGRGPVHYKQGAAGRTTNVYCNPQLRGLGPKPTTRTGFAKVDAFLYINRPGYSGAGGCNGAPPRAGTWWPARALMFGRYATEWVRPPKGTRFGFRGRVSLCRLGAPLKEPKGYSNRDPARRC